MIALLGMAGAGAAGLIADWALLGLCILLTWAAAFLALLLRSRLLTLASAAGWALAAVFRPWEVFGAEPPDDWEAAELHSDFRLLAWLWVVASVGVAAACLDAFQRRVRRTPA